MEDDYAQVARGPLKLKKDSEIKKKKKKKNKSKDKEKMEKVLVDKPPAEEQQSKAPVRQLTKAELAFKKMQEKIQKERIKQRAAMTHKQKVEKFNEHLDSLTEHFDIPKVSWTK
ncbi:protein FAM32A [Culicoides brevitarsis]|uniref:protein FAM32A n=1 Tax=Culicoides brevitarsis TaxID=469753 RepID=UPI00307B9813